ncbi:exosome 3'-_5 exonuclease subunit ski4 (Csl4) [Didymosphaeria variabile]|uniref:Exosome 3'->5 exonuclease subunit ski4 (Csl4) n=1 Tax=Didymosphaeria variabile TaxID=1932322 RepID=A0A9W9CDT1_9PLEO|nr:exosome 3'->5 exonuclease subunit ski4 (Csl4) [Didymosphaeria variabile]KAJ4356636.1 exosome 3'->5 exonuclease subunit ski4 (Csl4) [Didymosphaeria variabile]
MALPTLALPGTLLGPASKYAPGPGTHIHDSSVYASIAGTVASSPSLNPTTTRLPLLSISRPGEAGASDNGNILPEVDSQVLARVTRLGARFASAEILVIAPSAATSISSDAAVCSTPFAAQIRREDIRATEKDKVTVQDSFRVGDLIRAVVISLGDQGGYYLSTAKNELGVVVARGEGGEVLVPVSWREVKDLRTGRGEARKVAKPF